MGQTNRSFTLIITKKQCVIDESEDLSYIYRCDSLFYRRNLCGRCAPFDPEPFYNFALGGIKKKFSFAISQFIFMQNKNQAELSSFYIFNLRDSVKDISREKLWFDSGKKKRKIRLVLSNWSQLSVSYALSFPRYNFI